MIVTFCGHSELSNGALVREWLSDVCERLIVSGADEFLLGGYGAFDELCDLKHQYCHIRLVLVLPYLNRAIPTAGYDEMVYPPLESVPRRCAILRRNEWMIQHSDMVVAYVIHDWGGAANTLEYAQRKKKLILQYGK